MGFGRSPDGSEALANLQAAAVGHAEAARQSLELAPRGGHTHETVKFSFDPRQLGRQGALIRTSDSASRMSRMANARASSTTAGASTPWAIVSRTARFVASIRLRDDSHRWPARGDSRSDNRKK
jgi:hypothetical protein